ncbi:MAG: PH domain-containing protein [Burkholderiales bacterium]
MSDEKALWSGTPSQLVNLPWYVLWLLLCWLVIPLLILLWQWLVIRNTVYELTSERLKLRSGVLNKELDEVELYRVRDYKLEQPFFLRLFGLGNITMQTSDRSHPVLTLRAVRSGERLYEQLRQAVEQSRAKKGVRELDVE